MRSCVIASLLACIIAQGQDSVELPANDAEDMYTLLSRALESWPVDGVDLDDTALAKAAHASVPPAQPAPVAIQRQMVARPPPPALMRQAPTVAQFPAALLVPPAEAADLDVESLYRSQSAVGLSGDPTGAGAEKKKAEDAKSAAQARRKELAAQRINKQRELMAEADSTKAVKASAPTEAPPAPAPKEDFRKAFFKGADKDKAAEPAPAPKVEASSSSSLGFDFDSLLAPIPAPPKEEVVAPAPAPVQPDIKSLEQEKDLQKEKRLEQLKAEKQQREEEAAAKKKEEAAAKEEAARVKKQEEEAAKLKKQEADAAAKQKKEAEAAEKRKEEEEAQAKKKQAEAEAAKKKQDEAEAAKKKQQEEQQRKEAEAAAKKKQEEAPKPSPEMQALEARDREAKEAQRKSQEDELAKIMDQQFAAKQAKTQVQEQAAPTQAEEGGGGGLLDVVPKVLGAAGVAGGAYVASQKLTSSEEGDEPPKPAPRPTPAPPPAPRPPAPAPAPPPPAPKPMAVAPAPAPPAAASPAAAKEAVTPQPDVASEEPDEYAEDWGLPIPPPGRSWGRRRGVPPPVADGLSARQRPDSDGISDVATALIGMLVGSGAALALIRMRQRPQIRLAA